MKWFLKVAMAAAFSFLFCFLSIGYAELADSLTINGTVEAAPAQGLYIAGVEVYNSSASSADGVAIYPTNVNATLRGANGRVVTYKITVFNNTPYKYAYVGIEYENSYGGNSYIGRGLTVRTKDNPGDTTATFNQNDVVEAGETITFYADYIIGSAGAHTDIATLINYEFGVHVDSMGDLAIDGALAKFREILNDTSPGGGYETLVDKIDDKYDGKNDWKANYIGNVVDSSSADSKTVNNLFEGELTLTLNGVKTNVTVLIKRENLDGNELTGDDYTATYTTTGWRPQTYTTSAKGCEMTLYMTTDALKNGNPLVYAAVFTCDRNADGSYGEWYMIGDMYYGTANIVGYEGGQSTGSFDTGTWRSTGHQYVASEDYRYTVVGGRTIGQLVQEKDASAVALFEYQINAANDLLSGVYGNYAGDAMIDLEEALAEAARSYTVNADGSLSAYANTTRAQVIPLIKHMDLALKPFEGILGN